MGDKKFKIYLFRHGQTRFNRDGMFTGWTDSRITKKGREDAKIVAERLKKRRFQVAIHTRLTRSKETLDIVMKGHPECVLVLEDDRMIERNYGRLSRFLHWGIVKKFGAKKYDEWHRSWTVRPPKGESFADVEVRVRSFIKDLKKFIKKNKVNVAISAHGNSIRLFRKIIEGASQKEAISWFIPYDGVFEYKV
jgi:2,3-bisphosphoglycerate-dependent phosphoglycerate mutase